MAVAQEVEAVPGMLRRFKRGALLLEEPEHATANALQRPQRRPFRLQLSESGARVIAGVMSAVVARTCVAPLERVKLENQIRSAETSRGSADNIKGSADNIKTTASLRTASNSVASSSARGGGGVASLSQSLRRIVRKEGVRGLWKGNGVNLIRTAPYKACNFLVFDTLHDLFLKRSGRPTLTNSERATAGAMAGVMSALLFFPLDVVRTRLIARRGIYKRIGVVGTMRHIVKREGPGGLYRGVLPALVSMAPNGAVFYGVYDVLKENTLKFKADAAGAQRGEGGTLVTRTAGSAAAALPERQQVALSVAEMLLFGAMAGVASESSTYPLDLVRRRLQLHTGAFGARAAFGRMVTLAVTIFKHDGPRGLYTGLAPSALQVLPSSALSYLTYETVKACLEERYVSRSPAAPPLV